MFVLNPRPADAPPLPPRGSRRFIAAWTLGGGLLLLALVGGVALLYGADNRALRSRGVVAAGVVLSVDADAQPPYLRFRFTDAAGREVTGQALGGRVARAYAVGDALAVRYLPGQPAVNTVDGHAFTPRWVVLGWPVLLALTLLALVWTVAEQRRVVRFRQAARRVPGVVVAAAVVIDEDGVEHLAVTYTFTPPGDTTPVQARETAPRAVSASAPPAPGTPVTVLALNRGTFRLV